VATSRHAGIIKPEMKKYCHIALLMKSAFIHCKTAWLKENATEVTILFGLVNQCTKSAIFVPDEHIFVRSDLLYKKTLLSGIFSKTPLRMDTLENDSCARFRVNALAG